MNVSNVINDHYIWHDHKSVVFSFVSIMVVSCLQINAASRVQDLAKFYADFRGDMSNEMKRQVAAGE